MGDREGGGSLPCAQWGHLVTHMSIVVDSGGEEDLSHVCSGGYM